VRPGRPSDDNERTREIDNGAAAASPAAYAGGFPSSTGARQADSSPRPDGRCPCAATLDVSFMHPKHATKALELEKERKEKRKKSLLTWDSRETELGAIRHRNDGVLSSHTRVDTRRLSGARTGSTGAVDDEWPIDHGGSLRICPG
jgi:hypothetical protein